MKADRQTCPSWRPRHLRSAFGVLLLLGLRCGVAAGDAEWQELKSRHFIVHFKGGRDFAETVSRRAETYYREIAEDLGYRRHDGFWLWENRARITLYGSREEFVRRTGSPEWASGKASYKERAIMSFHGSRRLLDSVLPHELTHLIFRDFVGFEGEVPLWLEEGIAQWEERADRHRVKRLTTRLLRTGRLMPLRQLTRLDIREESRLREATEFYLQAASLVGYLIEEHGSVRFRKLCGQLRDGKSLEDALRFTYPSSVRSIEQLESAWHRHLAQAASGAGRKH